MNTLLPLPYMFGLEDSCPGSNNGRDHSLKPESEIVLSILFIGEVKLMS
jgi:hypothetical protein